MLTPLVRRRAVSRADAKHWSVSAARADPCCTSILRAQRLRPAVQRYGRAARASTIMMPPPPPPNKSKSRDTTGTPLLLALCAVTVAGPPLLAHTFSHPRAVTSEQAATHSLDVVLREQKELPQQLAPPKAQLLMKDVFGNKIGKRTDCARRAAAPRSAPRSPPPPAFPTRTTRCSSDAHRALLMRSDAEVLPGRRRFRRRSKSMSRIHP